MAGGSEHGKVFGLSLWKQVFLGMILGIALGFYLKYSITDSETLKAAAEDVKILGAIFLTLIKMVVAPLIFLALVSGITSIRPRAAASGPTRRARSACSSTCICADAT